MFFRHEDYFDETQLYVTSAPSCMAVYLCKVGLSFVVEGQMSVTVSWPGITQSTFYKQLLRKTLQRV